MLLDSQGEQLSPIPHWHACETDQEDAVRCQLLLEHELAETLVSRNENRTLGIRELEDLLIGAVCLDLVMYSTSWPSSRSRWTNGPSTSESQRNLKRLLQGAGRRLPR